MSILPKVYLSAAIEWAPDNGIGWREVAQETLHKLGYDVYNPATDEEALLAPHGLADSKALTRLKFTDLDKFQVCIKKIIDYDIDVLLESDLVLLYLDSHFSGGSAGEITLARHFKIPVIAIVNKSNLVPISGWMLGCCDVMVASLEEALQYIKDNPIKKRDK